MHDQNPSRPVTAAPNESLLKLRLITCSQSQDDARKWLLSFEIIETSVVFGPQFAEPGKTVEGFSFENFQNFRPGDTLSARAEYLGGAHHGYYQLTRPEKKD
ncbi:hypothetical protein [Nitrosomonas marina]|uniref:Uncharacterized protein n=1 Tax=Nitrosomonas marina TaxID=917 RepID=A0A1H8FNM6_9PROT|nr:hypothetical protein [Nitrosomonas marina]SEN33303.1 hypothetical protein SAMN05216325_11410 [Nitrosomonas marina]